MKTDLPPCDFDAFVAQRRDISEDEARTLIRSWLASYVPRPRLSRCGADFATPLAERHA